MLLQPFVSNNNRSSQQSNRFVKCSARLYFRRHQGCYSIWTFISSNRTTCFRLYMVSFCWVYNLLQRTTFSWNRHPSFSSTRCCGTLTNKCCLHILTFWPPVWESMLQPNSPAQLNLCAPSRRQVSLHLWSASLRCKSKLSCGRHSFLRLRRLKSQDV